MPDILQTLSRPDTVVPLPREMSEPPCRVEEKS